MHKAAIPLILVLQAGLSFPAGAQATAPAGKPTVVPIDGTRVLLALPRSQPTNVTQGQARGHSPKAVPIRRPAAKTLSR
jgi:hypothetical protein